MAEVLTNSVAQPLTVETAAHTRREEADMSGQTIGVIGAGLMGHGIAYLLAAAGHTVRIYDPSAEWRRFAAGAAGKLARVARRRSGAARPHLGARPDGAGDAGRRFVFEAAPEKLPLKQQIFAELESRHRADTILASNSSAIPSTRSATSSSTAIAWSARISGIRRISCRWSKSRRTN